MEDIELLKGEYL